MLLATTIAVLAPAACSSERERSCADLRAAVESFTPEPQQAWEDIEGLQESVAEALRVRTELEERCGPAADHHSTPTG